MSDNQHIALILIATCIIGLFLGCLWTTAAPPRRRHRRTLSTSLPASPLAHDAEAEAGEYGNVLGGGRWL